MTTAAAAVFGPRDCFSGRKACSNVGSLDEEKLGYCPMCYDALQKPGNLAIPLDEFREAIHERKPVGGPRVHRETVPLGGTMHASMMVYSARNFKCEKCKEVMKPGSIAIGQPGKKTVQRAYDPGTYVWKGQVSVTKVRHPGCIPITDRMISDLREEESASDAAKAYFRGTDRLPPTTRSALEEWIEKVTSPAAEADRKLKRQAAAGLNRDGSKKPRGKFKPKAPPVIWKSLSRDEMMKKSASALKNFLKTYTYEKVPKSVTKSKLIDIIVELMKDE